MVARASDSQVLHIRFEGQSFDVLLSDLDIGTLSNNAEIKRSLAEYLDITVGRLRDYVVDRHDTGNLTVRPEAVFG